MAELRIRLDEVDKALLGTLARVHGCSEEEVAVAILKRGLQIAAEDAVPIELIELRLEEEVSDA